MFEDYEDYFDEPSEAEKIIQKATDDLKNLLTETTKNVIAQAASAEKELESLQSKIREKEYKLSKIEGQIAETEQRAETVEMLEAPRRYINRFVRDVIGDFAPGDTVWIIENNGEYEECPLCRKQKKIHACVGDAEYDVQCPKCNGSGLVYADNRIVTEKRISDIHLRLCFSDRVRYWSGENIYLAGRDYSTPLTSLYKTREEAESALLEQE